MLLTLTTGCSGGVDSQTLGHALQVGAVHLQGARRCRPASLGTSRPVVFIHCARTPQVQGFRARIDALALKHPQLQCHYVYEEPGAEPVDGVLGRWLPASREVDAYFCGPQPFMAAVQLWLRTPAVPAAQTRFEFFGPRQAL